MVRAIVCWWLLMGCLVYWQATSLEMSSLRELWRQHRESGSPAWLGAVTFATASAIAIAIWPWVIIRLGERR